VVPLLLGPLARSSAESALKTGLQAFPGRPSQAKLHRTCMAVDGFCTDSARRGIEDHRMDALAIALGVVMFAILFGLIYAIDRI
jgi:hypothetical protein